MIEEKTAVPNLAEALPDFAQIRLDLLAQRRKVGADTPIGHRCSNIAEQIENYLKCEPGTNRLKLRNLIGQQMRDIRRLLVS